jgi:hypothetical protein
VLAVLRDGQPHTVNELLKCFNDELSDNRALRTCLSRMRGELAAQGLSIIFTITRRRRAYCLVRPVTPDVELPL